MIHEILAVYALGAVALFMGLRIKPGVPWWRDALVALLWPAMFAVVVFEGPSAPPEDS